MRLDNKGATLVEVLAGFTLLVVLVTSFVKIIKLSSELTTAAVDNKIHSLEFEEQYYSKELAGTTLLPASGTTLKLTEISSLNDMTPSNTPYELSGTSIDRVMIGLTYVHRYVNKTTG